MKRVIRVGKWLLLLGLVVLVGLGGGVWWWLRQSLPRTAGSASVSGLRANVQVARDALGVPTIRGASFDDVVRGQGFVHAQDRFFQMDLARRATAGELAALLGPAVLPMDRAARLQRCRHRAGAALERLPRRHRLIVDAYVEGVNAGLADLGARPPEYGLLRATPEPWTAEDSVLMLYFFAQRLALNDRLEKPAGVMRDVLPPELFEFLTPDTSRFDAPLITHNPSDTQPLPIPGRDVVDLRTQPEWNAGRRVVRPLGAAPPLPAGSNSWAVNGSRSAHGGAILAGDPHLVLAVPNVWYRVELAWEQWTLLGVGPAGVPGIVMGTNDRIAWAATNSIVDRIDLVVVEPDPKHADRYLARGGDRTFTDVVETIVVKGGDDETLTVRETRWGPIVDMDWRGRPLAMRAPFLDEGGADLGIFDLFECADLDRAMDILRAWKGPSLNWVLATDTGRIGWVVGGDLPERFGFDGRAPESWADGTRGWSGLLGERERPALIDPPSGVLYSANHRTVPLEQSRALGRAWMLPARAHRIAQRLDAQETYHEDDMQRMQLDVRSELHDLIQGLVAQAASGESDPLVQQAAAHVASWTGEAEADSPGFRIVHAYYGRLMEAVLAPLLRPAVEADPTFVYNWPLADEPLRRILSARPSHLVPPGHDSWEACLRAVLLDTVHALESDPSANDGLDTSWGEVHRVAMRHPLSRAVPALGPLLDMPRDAVPGWRATVRVETPGYGATMRMVVSPGHLDEALFTMPGGQSGHPLSPWYRAGHDDWVRGNPRPLRPGPPVSTFVLTPP